MTGIIALYLIFAAGLAFPSRFGPVTERPPANTLRNIGGAAIDLFSGQAGVGGILANIFMSLSGMPMNKSIGRAATAGSMRVSLGPIKNLIPRIPVAPRRVILHAEPK